MNNDNNIQNQVNTNAVVNGTPVQPQVVPEGIGVRMPNHTANMGGGVTVIGGGQPVVSQPAVVDNTTVATPRNIASLNSQPIMYGQGGGGVAGGHQFSIHGT